MEIILFGLATIGLILLANLLIVRGNQTTSKVYSGFLLLLNLPVMLIGVAFLFLPTDLIEQVLVQLSPNSDSLHSFGFILVLTAVWGMLVTLRPVRLVLARLMRLNPDSPVHTLALVMVGYLVGQSVLTMSQGGLDALAESAAPASIVVFVFSELFFVIVALFGVGFLIRRQGRQLAQRLGLEKPKPIHLLIGVGWIVLLVVLQAIAGAAWALLNPEQAELLENVNNLLLADVDTVWEWFLLALAAGIGEELLFRGALQPVLGLGFTAVLFGLVHVQYGYTPILVFIMLLAVILGLVRRYYNTTIAIFVHAGYNFTLGLLALLAAYLEQFIV